jgi:PRTRC genetic system protein B
MPTALHNASDGLTALSQLLRAEPTLTLKVYPFGVLMQRKTPQGCMEYLIDPAQLALQLAATVRLETGILASNTIYISQEGVQKLVVEYRPRQKTALFLEGSEAPVIVPLPELLLFRRTTDKGLPDYRVFAVKARPTNLTAKLFHAPLPNLYEDGRVCWGSVQHLQAQQLTGTHLTEDWKVLLGTRFGSHNVGRRSKSQPADIRKKYLAMEAAKTRVYPKSDLLPANRTLEDVLEGLRR